MRKLLLAAAALPADRDCAGSGSKCLAPRLRTPLRTRWPITPGPRPIRWRIRPRYVPSQGPNFISVPDTAMLTSNIVGLDIYNAQNERHRQNSGCRSSTAAMRSRGTSFPSADFLGMGTHYVAVNPDAVSITYRLERQDLARRHERHQGPAQGRARIPVRRQMDGQPELSLLQLCWGRWREAPDGVRPAAATLDRIARPSGPDLQSNYPCFPHPIRPSGPTSPLRGEGGARRDRLVCIAVEPRRV